MCVFSGIFFCRMWIFVKNRILDSLQEENSTRMHLISQIRGSGLSSLVTLSSRPVPDCTASLRVWDSSPEKDPSASPRALAAD